MNFAMIYYNRIIIADKVKELIIIMKKAAICAAVSAMLLSTSVVYAGYSQSQLETVIDNAFSWQDNYASPNSSPGSNASDYYIMALSRMNKSYNFDSYIRRTESITPYTKQDGQRLIMTNSACGQRLSNAFVALFTYDAELDTASDIAGALITLDSGGYHVVDSDMDKNNMVSTLMSMQQSNGSFDNNVLSTAKAVIALSNYINTVYELNAAEGNGSYTYNTNSSISAALDYLSANQNADGGYGTITDTAYTVIALDSIGVDADNDTRFQKDGNSGVGFLVSMQYSDGSFISSADDTAIASCALVSHLRAMQGKSKFFSFTVRDNPSSAHTSEAETENHAGEGSVSPPANASAPPTPTATHNVVHLTPLPTKAPEHSAVSAEAYGPFPFVGPKQEATAGEKGENILENDDTDDDDGGMTGKTKGIIIIVAVLLLMAGSVLYLYKSQPEAFIALFKKNNAVSKKAEKDSNQIPKEGIDAIDFDNYKFVESELVNSYLDNFDKLKTENENSISENQSGDDVHSDDNDEFIDIPKI